MPDYTVKADVDTMLRANDKAAIRSAIGVGQTDAPTFLAQSLTGQSLTGTQATSLVDLATTWLSTTGTPTAIKLNVTDTASNAASNLMDLQVGGVSKFKVDKTGVLTVAASPAYNTATALRYDASNSGISFTAGDLVSIVSNGVGVASFKFNAGVLLKSTLPLSWGNADVNGATALSLFRDADNILAQRNGTAKQVHRVYNTFLGTTANEWGGFDWLTTANTLRIGTEHGGTGTARPIDFVTGGVVRMSIAAAGAVSFGAGTASAPAITFGDSGTGLWRQTADRIGISASGTNMVVVYNSGMYMASGAFGVGTSNWLRIGTTGFEMTTTSGGGTLTDLKMRNVIQSPGIGTTVTPANNSELVFETTSNTSVTVKLKGSDGTVRSFALTLV